MRRNHPRMMRGFGEGNSIPLYFSPSEKTCLIMRMAIMRAEYGFGRMRATSLACTTMALIDFSCMRERVSVPSSIVACVKEKTAEGLFGRSLALSFAMASIVVWNGLIFRMKAFGSVSLGIPLVSAAFGCNLAIRADRDGGFMSRDRHPRAEGRKCLE